MYITLKKYEPGTKPAPRKGSMKDIEPSENKCLWRGTDGKKISTMLSTKEERKFQIVSSNY
ncbi:Signal recognition particle 14 kDa protein [Sciurus carolinensis]|uniref:Signal recognition particle 14 kDa protein n=1 Tax=Sciurus carolinensis TaxID=30640 RepID=A0AA41MUP4_SCICA|nr:Signal recognition particle 14 kDa protein [Sciurus carolinensis]